MIVRDIKINIIKEVLVVFVLAMALSSITCANDKLDQKADLMMMTWYSILLPPRVAEITILGTITNVEMREVYGNPYYDVDITIDEILFIKEDLKKYIEGKKVVRAGDFNCREKNERVIIFAGGEPYKGNDFVSPSWEGTGSNIGIVLYPEGHKNYSFNEKLLNKIREVVKGKKVDSNFFEAFANFCPICVAQTFIMEMRQKEILRRNGGQTLISD